MKREFLQNLKVGDQALPKEIIDAIMDENGKDIEAAKKPFADYEAIKERLKTAEDGLKAFDCVDVKDLQGKIDTLKGQLSDKDKEWQAKLDNMAFDGRVNGTSASSGTGFVTGTFDGLRKLLKKCPRGIVKGIDYSGVSVEQAGFRSVQIHKNEKGRRCMLTQK